MQFRFGCVYSKGQPVVSVGHCLTVVKKWHFSDQRTRKVENILFFVTRRRLCTLGIGTIILIVFMLFYIFSGNAAHQRLPCLLFVFIDEMNLFFNW